MEFVKKWHMLAPCDLHPVLGDYESEFHDVYFKGTPYHLLLDEHLQILMMNEVPGVWTEVFEWIENNL